MRPRTGRRRGPLRSGNAATLEGGGSGGRSGRGSAGLRPLIPAREPAALEVVILQLESRYLYEIRVCSFCMLRLLLKSIHLCITTVMREKSTTVEGSRIQHTVRP
ncbi:unnamed protein product [Caretta caretta]